jgi:hypothetical protein
MNKVRLSVYLDPDTMAQVNDLAKRNKQSRSLIAEAAISSFVTPDDSDRREAALVRRLDLLTRHGERLERDLSIAVEAIALFIKFWLTVTPPLPDNAQAAAQAKGRERFESFLETLGRRLARGKSVLREVSIDRVNEHDSAPEMRSTIKSGPMRSDDEAKTYSAVAGATRRAVGNGGGAAGSEQVDDRGGRA